MNTAMNTPVNAAMNTLMNTPLISGDLAATEADVSPATIRKWVQLGHLKAAGRQGRRSMYRLEDVFAAERLVRGARM